MNPYEIYSYEVFSESDGSRKCVKYAANIKGLPPDGRLVAVASFTQSGDSLGNYQKLQFQKGEAVIILSASLDNNYWLFGFKETEQTLN